MEFALQVSVVRAVAAGYVVWGHSVYAVAVGMVRALIIVGRHHPTRYRSTASEYSAMRLVMVW